MISVTYSVKYECVCGDREIKNPAVRKYSVLQSIGHGVPKILNIQVFGVYVYFLQKCKLERK